MGSILYDFFSNSLLSDPGLITSGFKTESEERLEKELQDYRQFCLDRFDDIGDEVARLQSSLKMFTSTEGTPLQLLKQTALYLDQFVIPDPLFSMTDAPSKTSDATSGYLGFAPHQFNKKKLASACRYMKDVTPMVAADFVKFFPLSYYFERQTIPLYGPDHYFKDVLPPDILLYMQDHAVVSALEKIKDGGGWIILDTLFPCRGISVDFVKSTREQGMIYFLFQSEVISVDKENREVVWRKTLPDTPPEKEEFDLWVQQSINSASRNFVERVFTEASLSSALGASFLSESEFTSGLLEQRWKKREDIESFTASVIMNTRVPFITQVNTDKLMIMREHDAASFTNFRIELEKHFRQLRKHSDDDQLRMEIENTWHELNKVQGHALQKKLSQIKKQMALQGAIAMGSLVGTVPSGGWSLLGVAVAAGQGYKNYLEYTQALKENPGYFLWKIKK